MKGPPKREGEIEPKYQTLSDLKRNEQIPLPVRQIIYDRHVTQRNQISGILGEIELAYRRGEAGLVEMTSERDALKAEVERLKNSRVEAAKICYMAGHNDTVDGQYGDPYESARDICSVLDEEAG